jgi:dTDP-glucose 4,6-dehydratase
MTKTILITGGAGFVGSALVRQAIAAKYRVINLDALTYAANLDNVASVSESPLYAFEQADIRDREALDRIFSVYQPDMLANVAAESHVDRSIDGPAEFIETNIVGTFTLLQAARSFWEKRGKPDDFRFLHVSTDEVYGALGPFGQFSEASPYNPHSPYSASKASADHLVRAWGNTYGLPVLISNCSNNYGPFQYHEKLIPRAISRALAGKPIEVYGTGSNVRDWLFVEDHVAALLMILEGGKVGDTYNIGGDAEVSNIEIVNRICLLLNERLTDTESHEKLIEFVPDRPGHDFRYAIDAAKIRSDLGWQPSVSLDKGLARTVDWYLENSSRTAIFGDGHRLGLLY